MRTSEYALIVLWVATVGQVSFVALWATRRWWATNVGQALMAESASLALLLAVSLWAHYRGPLHPPFGLILFTVLAAAIVDQLGALLWELHKARRERRRGPGVV